MSVKNTNTLSIDVNAALASAGFAAPDAPEPTPTESDPAADEAAPTGFFRDNADETDPTETAEDTTSDDADEDLWDIPAYGQTHKVNMSKKDEVRKLLSAGLGAKQVHSKLATSKQEIKRLTDELKAASTHREKADLFDKLESIKDDESELYRVITGGRSLDEIVNARLEKKLKYMEASPADQARMEAAEREAQLTTRLERMEANIRGEKEQAAKSAEEASDSKTYSVMYPEFQTVFKELGIKDPVQAQETAADLWELGWARIARLAKQADENKQPLDLTPELVRRQFQVVAKRWGHTSKAAAKEEVSKIIDKKSKVAAKQAGLAASKNYSTSASNDELSRLSPTQAFDRLFKNKR